MKLRLMTVSLLALMAISVRAATVEQREQILSEKFSGNVTECLDESPDSRNAVFKAYGEYEITARKYLVSVKSKGHESLIENSIAEIEPHIVKKEIATAEASYDYSTWGSVHDIVAKDKCKQLRENFLILHK